MGHIYNWSQIIEYVLKLEHQQDIWVPKESVVHPHVAGIPYSCFAYRKTVPDGRAVDIKEEGDFYCIHWDRYNPATHLIEHGLDDAPELWLLTTIGSGAATGAIISEEGKKGRGALVGAGIGLGFGLFILFVRAMTAKN